MPDYNVTDPRTGRSFTLTGDTPPSEQELSEIFQTQRASPRPSAAAVNLPIPAPRRASLSDIAADALGTTAPTPAPWYDGSRILDTAKDVAVGFGKGVANTITSPAQMLAPLINKMAVKSYGSRAALPPDNAADTFLRQLDATNTAQKIGKGIEFASELVGPSAVAKVSRAAEASKVAAPAGERAIDVAARLAAPARETQATVTKAAALADKIASTPGGTAEHAAQAIEKHVAALVEPNNVRHLQDIHRLDFHAGVLSERGAASSKLTLGLGGAAAGAAAGATQGETTSERVKNAALGGAAGAIAVPLVAHAIASSGSLSKTAQNAIYNSVLSSPTSVAKAYLGGVGGAIAAATEKIAAGRAAEGNAILERLFSPKHITDIIAGLKNPEALKTNVSLAEQAGYGGKESLVGRVFDAANAPAIRAMEAGGVSANDAWRYTLSGPPTSPLGKDVINLWNRYFGLRMATSLFPRVGIQILERGLERSPLGLVKGLGLQTAGTVEERAARALLGPVAGATAYANSDNVPEWAQPYVTALAGVYGLPVAMGFGAGDARARGKSPSAQATAAITQLSNNTPFPRFGPSEAIKQVATGATLVPNILRDVAVARDPYERKTAGDFFARAKAKIPGLRETLPIKGRNVNVAGQPIEDRSSALTRVLSPAATVSAPMRGVPSDVAAELSRLEIPLNPPAFSQTVKVGNREFSVPADAAERARVERRQYLIPQVQHAMNTPVYANADDNRRKRILQAVIQRAEAAGSARAQANLLKLLRAQGAFRR